LSLTHKDSIRNPVLLLARFKSGFLTRQKASGCAKIGLTPLMELIKMIAELRAERAAVDEALSVLERLARTQGKRRGRPPAWLKVVGGAADAIEGRTRTFSDDTRKRMAEAQKRRWAAFRKAKAVVAK